MFVSSSFSSFIFLPSLLPLFRFFCFCCFVHYRCSHLSPVLVLLCHVNLREYIIGNTLSTQRQLILNLLKNLYILSSYSVLNRMWHLVHIDVIVYVLVCCILRVSVCPLLFYAPASCICCYVPFILLNISLCLHCALNPFCAGRYVSSDSRPQRVQYLLARTVSSVPYVVGGTFPLALQNVPHTFTEWI